MVSRIQEILKVKNLTPTQFADLVGVQRSSMSHILSGRNKPSLEFILKILRTFPDIKAEWLLHGDNTPIIGQQVDEKNLNENEFTLFDIPPMVEKPKVSPLNRSQSGDSEKNNQTVKRIEKVIVFFDDRTFREYNHE